MKDELMKVFTSQSLRGEYALHWGLVHDEQARGTVHGSRLPVCNPASCLGQKHTENTRVPPQGLERERFSLWGDFQGNSMLNSPHRRGVYFPAVHYTSVNSPILWWNVPSTSNAGSCLWNAHSISLLSSSQLGEWGSRVTESRQP